MGNQENSKSLIFHFSKRKISDFSLMTGDKNILHKNDQFAKDNGYEGGRIVNGSFILSISNSLVANFVGNGCLIISQEVKYLKPCYSENYYKFCIDYIQNHLGGNYAEYKVSVSSVENKKIINSKLKYLVKKK